MLTFENLKQLNIGEKVRVVEGWNEHRGQWFVKQVRFRVLYIRYTCIRTHVLHIYTHTVDRDS